MKVVIDQLVYEKVMYWVQKAKTKEVSGLGTLKVEGDSFRVTSAMLLPQKNGATHTDIEADSVCKALYELRDAPGDLKWWWHSHVDMGVFWSGTDHATIQSFGAGGWIVATVFNKKAERKSAFYSRDGKVTPFGVEYLFIDDVKTELSCDAANQKAWDEEYDKNVTALEKFSTVGDIATSSDDFRYEEDGYWAGSVWRPYRSAFPLPSRDVGTGRFVTTATGVQTIPPATKEKEPKMSKAERRALKKQARQNSVKSIKPMSTKIYDDYGYTGDDWKILGEVGYDNRDVDNMIEDGFTPSQIVSLAQDGVDADEALELLAQGFTTGDIVGRNFAERMKQ